MRLDKFLKVSRLIKRRTVANEACDAGRVLVNGKPAKASVKVKIGDVIEIQFGTKTVKVEVLDLQDTTKKKKRKICSAIYKPHSVSVHREIRGKGKSAVWDLRFVDCFPHVHRRRR